MKPDIAMAHLEMILADIPDEGVILEWGSGGSTEFFADNKPEAAELYSIENDRSWWEKSVGATYDKPATNVWLYPPTLGLKAIGPYGTHFRENPVGQEMYIGAPEVERVLKKADVIFVDGTARGACLATAAIHKQANCCVYLHDAERPWYDWTIPLFSLTELVAPAKGHSGSLRRFL